MTLLFRHRPSFPPPCDGSKAGKHQHDESPNFLGRAIRFLLPAIFVSAIYANLLLVGIAGFFFWTRGLADPFALGITFLLLALALAPLRLCDNRWGHGFMSFVSKASGEYFPMTVLVEDKEALRRGRPYMLALEPHSSLPVAWPVVFNHSSPLLPESLRGCCYGVVSSMCFVPPFVRQLYWTLGLRSATRDVVKELLEAGMAVVICPGGVQECLYMSHDDELVFLKNRKGFVRLALQSGAPLVPIFAFNQGKAYSWYRPGPPLFRESWIQAISRQIGVVPMSVWGRWGTPLPHRTPVNVVIGRPIEVPAAQPEPPPELVEEYLDKFILEMQALFERHKGSYGCGKMNLRVM